MLKKQTYIGWDIGGAHLKIARLSERGQVQEIKQIACPLWQGITALERAYQSANIVAAGAPVCHSVTMSGESVDHFANRGEGVCAILNCVRSLLDHPFLVYAGDHGLIEDAHARGHEKSIASMNWHATAQWLSSQYEAGILVDMGSTTTDLIPFKAGRIDVDGYDDATRLCAGELVYTGLSRTPLMAIAESIAIDGIKRPIVAECFANTADIYRILGLLPERADLYPSCDHGDKTIESSAYRLERMFGGDWNGDMDTTLLKARAFADLQQKKIVEALLHLIEKTQLPARAWVVGGGVGHTIVQAIATKLGLRFVPYYQALSDLPVPLRDAACDCATAVSVASLAHRWQR